MFRRRDNEPARPEGLPERQPDSSQSRAPNDPLKPQPELPRRQVDLPTGPAAQPMAAPERPQPQPQPQAAATPVDAPSSSGAATTTSAEGKRLIVGQGISLSGEITACDRLVVEGIVEVTLNETRAVEIAETGRFTGGCEVEEAEISGVYEGELTVRKRLHIKSSGRVKGTVRYGEIEIERGGRLTGSVSMLEGNE